MCFVYGSSACLHFPTLIISIPNNGQMAFIGLGSKNMKSALLYFARSCSRVSANFTALHSFRCRCVRGGQTFCRCVRGPMGLPFCMCVRGPMGADIL